MSELLKINEEIREVEYGNTKGSGEKAGVSFITVSRVINKNGYVKEETRERVLKAVAELNYYPNTIGRALQSNRLHTIGIVIQTNNTISVFGSPYYNNIMIGIEKVCSEHNHDIVISTQKTAQGSDYDFLRLFYERKVDGIILIAPDISTSQLMEIEEKKIPCVVIGARMDSYHISYVDAEQRKGIFSTGEYLFKGGHRNIAFVKGDFGSNSVERYKGFCDFANKYELNLLQEWVIDGDYTAEGGRNVLQTLVEQKNMPTAIFCSNDLFALGFMDEARKKGVKIPDDISVVGFDGIEAHKYSVPSLFTMGQPLFDMGRAGAEILFAQIKNPDRGKEIRIFQWSV